MIGKISKIETLGLADGPGIRTVIFMQGCTLRCIYCHNPETWNINSGKKYTKEELVKIILKYKNYYGNVGGVTFSGGEPLLQSKFLYAVCKELKKYNINIVLDTSGVGTLYDELLDLVDLIIFDIKGIDRENYFNMTSGSIKSAEDFIKKINKKNKKVWIRSVIVPGINDNKDYILKLKKYIEKINNIEKIELLPYHTLGIQKYEKLNIDYKLKTLPAMDKLKCDELYELLISDN